jgi:SHS2 domain-containing protein
VSYRWAEHVGELELRVEAPSREEVFMEGLRALAEVLGGEEPAEAPLERRDVELASDDLPSLLADWLGELAFLAETEGFVPASVEHLELAPGRLRARVCGSIGSPPHLVKAVTYHRLAFEPDGGGWRAVAVLDV